VVRLLKRFNITIGLKDAKAISKFSGNPIQTANRGAFLGLRKLRN
jgi:hypothetical protein